MSTAAQSPGTPWLEWVPADFDATLAARGHKRGPEQSTLFYVPTPARDVGKDAPEGQDGQPDLFGSDAP